jgi:hypothetical protein
MKKALIVFIIATCASLSVGAQEPDEGVVIEVFEETETTPPTSRTSGSISCIYYPTLEIVELFFLSDLGTSDIVVSNLSTGTVNYYQNAGVGVAIIPIQDPGPIIIQISTSSGHRYKACFIS